MNKPKTSITSSAVLVEQNISVWTANKLDRTVTEDMLVAKHAVSGAAQVRKNLMAGTSDRKNIADYSAGCRLWHNQNTMPWADKGVRLLPTSLFMEYKRESNQRLANFNTMVDEFLQNYDNLVAVAGNYMGDLFDASDYPSADTVAECFGYRIVFSPVPEAGDFRLDIPQKELEEVIDGYEESFNSRLKEAMKEPWNRMHKLLSTMSNKLDDSGDSKKRYHDSLIDNAVDLCDMLKHMNVTQDPALESARVQLQKAMKGRDIEGLKEYEHERYDLKEKVDKILGGFDW